MTIKTERTKQTNEQTNMTITMTIMIMMTMTMIMMTMIMMTMTIMTMTIPMMTIKTNEGTHKQNDEQIKKQTMPSDYGLLPRQCCAARRPEQGMGAESAVFLFNRLFVVVVVVVVG